MTVNSQGVVVLNGILDETKPSQASEGALLIQVLQMNVESHTESWGAGGGWRWHGPWA